MRLETSLLKEEMGAKKDSGIEFQKVRALRGKAFLKVWVFGNGIMRGKG